MIDWTAFTSQSFATLFTGVAAVGAALLVAWQQIVLKRQELRLSLFEHRKRHLDHFKKIRSEFLIKGTLIEASVIEIRSLLNEVKLVFDDDVVADLDTVWDAAFWQSHHNKMMKEYREDGMREEYQESVKEMLANQSKLITSVGVTLEKLEKATRIGKSL